MTYENWLSQKQRYEQPVGFDATVSDGFLFPFQRALVKAALEYGRFGMFAETGLGKGRMELASAAYTIEHARKVGLPPRAILLAPLAIGPQTVREAAKCGIPDVKFCRSQDDVVDGITVTNYDSLHKFDPSSFTHVTLDEAAILRNDMGSVRTNLIRQFSSTPYRLVATATPVPNDHKELGNYSEFLGILQYSVMLARYFKNDSSDTGEWILKGHARRLFWDWIASWSRCLSLPSDLGDYDDTGYILPPLQMHKHIVPIDVRADEGSGMLFRTSDSGAGGIHKEKRLTAEPRAAKTAELVMGERDEQWIVWVGTDYEADAVCAAIPEAVEVRGSMDVDTKTGRLLAFADGNIRVLVTKPRIAGYGLNYQNCRRQVFAGLSYSWEEMYQPIRRSYRFGQTHQVDIHVVMGSTETHLWDAISRKQDGHDGMKQEMVAASRRAAMRMESMRTYNPTHTAPIPAWFRSE